MQLRIQAWGDLHASMWKMDVGSPPIRSRRFVVCREIDKWQGWVWRRLDGRVPGFDHGPILRWWDFGNSTVPRNCTVPRNSTIQCTTAPIRMLFRTIMHSVLLLIHWDEPNKKINTSISPYCTAHPNQEYAIPPKLLVWSYFTIPYHTAQNCSVLNEGHFSAVHW